MQTAEFDALVSGFYRAATGETDWQAALSPVRQAFDARFAALHAYDAQGRMLSLQHNETDEQAGVLAFVRDWQHLDPRKQRALKLGPAAFGTWMHCHDAFDDAYVSRHPFFRHFMLGHDCRYNSNVVLPVSEDVATAFILELPHARGPLNADERDLARRLGAHLQDALRAHERVRKLAAQALAGHQLLASLAYPIWLIDTDRYIFHANPAAQTEQVEGRWAAPTEDLAARGENGSRLRLRGSRSDARLVQHLLRFQGGRHGDRAVIDARQRVDESPAWLHLQVVSPQQALAAFGDRPLVLATLFAPQIDQELDAFALGDVFGLTPAQARIAVLLADGCTAAEIGSRIGCAVSTVRTHMRQVLAKLGASRATDAVRLLRQGEVLWHRAAYTPQAAQHPR